MRDLIQIDGLFERFLKGAVNPRPLYPMQFTLRAHSAYRVGVGTVMAGQLYESQTVLRLCLEHAAYGFFIGSDNARMERWLRRGDSEQNRKAVRKEFQNEKLREHIRKQAPALCDSFDHLYSQLIDFGAHPNEQGYSMHSTIVEADDRIHFNAIYLQGDGMHLDFAMKVAAQVGLWPLLLMQLLYRERYELLGIRAELEQLRKRF
jgi:hypothetical protein